jgi:beta-galactosidase
LNRSSFKTFLAVTIVLGWANTVGVVCSRGAEENVEIESKPRNVVDWDKDWRFSKGDFASAMSQGFKDRGWRQVRLPHDWSTEEPFRADYGSGNGFAAGGIGWYRKHFKTDPSWQGKSVGIEFDGVYENAEVWINGQFVGGRPYGYSSFACDLTPYLNLEGADNAVAVRVDHSRFADSRWYTGSGIYRHVHLCITEKLHVAHWGTSITTPEVSPDAATVRVETTIQNEADAAKNFVLQLDILDASEKAIASTNETVTPETRTTKTLTQTLKFEHPQLWSPESPTLYTLRTRVLDGAVLKDETRTSFGVRSLRFDPDKGFALNGQPMKWKGVCLHHDFGPLGAAVPDKVLEQRLRVLKELGVNAIRTTHNPPAPELLDFCDRLGLLVKEEAFDEFTPTKRKWVEGWNKGEPSRFGYGEIFKEWSVRDLQDMIRRDRNHPCVILWSIGNEIDYPNDPFSHPVLGKEYKPANPRAEEMIPCAEPLIAAAKALDPTRPVTAALASIIVSNAVGLADRLDAVGYNYQEDHYAEDHQKYPKRFIFGSENNHSYRAWLAVRDNEFVAGQFLWTGADYLGEAPAWPQRANPSGLLDLCGFKKPLAWFRQSLWSDKPMVYLCIPAGFKNQRFAADEHWNWPDGKIVKVACFTNCAEVELMLNDKSLGVKPLTSATDGTLTWQIPFEPGVLKAVGRTNGTELCSYKLETAGAAKQILLKPDARELRADDNDICRLEFQVVDEHGLRVPDAAQPVTFEVTGSAELLGIGNADLNDTEDCHAHTHKVFKGRGLAILRTTDMAGEITVKATAPNLETASVVLRSKK